MLLDFLELGGKVLPNRPQEFVPLLQLANRSKRINGVIDAGMEIFLAATQVWPDKDRPGDDGDNLQQLLVNHFGRPVFARSDDFIYGALDFSCDIRKNAILSFAHVSKSCLLMSFSRNTHSCSGSNPNAGCEPESQSLQHLSSQYISIQSPARAIISLVRS